MNLHSRIRAYLSPEESLPAAGQGALGIEICDHRDDMREWLRPLACEQTTACILAERAVSRVLGGSCQVPLAAYATCDEGMLTLSAMVASPDGLQIVRAEGSGPLDQAEFVGESAARLLLDGGAKAILATLTD